MNSGEQLIEQGLELRFGAGARQVGDGLSLEHGIDRGDRLHPELRGDEAFLIDIDLGQDDAPVGIIGRNFLQHGGECLARLAPFRPEIDQNRRFGLQHLGLKRRLGDLECPATHDNSLTPSRRDS